MISDRQDPAMFKHANKMLGTHFSREQGHKIISFMQDKKPVAHAIFTGITPGVKAELTVWAGEKGLAGKDFLTSICRIVFVQWQCKRLTAIVRPSNTRSQRAVSVMGFEFETFLARWFGDEDGWVYRLFPENCRWKLD
jgi:RimJ/RimL family protein N-acetyltransferase